MKMKLFVKFSMFCLRKLQRSLFHVRFFLNFSSGEDPGPPYVMDTFAVPSPCADIEFQSTYSPDYFHVFFVSMVTPTRFLYVGSIIDCLTITSDHIKIVYFNTKFK